MTQRVLESVAAPQGDGLVGSGLREWIVRAVSILYVAALVPSLTLAWSQLELLNPWWLAGIAGGIVGASVVMPFYAWSERGIGVPAVLYALSVLMGLASWPFAWRGISMPSTQPWIWVCFVMASSGLALVVGYWTGVAYLAVCVAFYFVVRLTPSGGMAPLSVAIEDALLAITLPIAVMVIARFSKRMVADVDDSHASNVRERESAAVKEALLTERSYLDAIVHDEVMTTLVAAARSEGVHDAALVDQARRTLRSLADAEGDPDQADPISSDHFVWLIRDIVTSVVPAAMVTESVSAPGPDLPLLVVRSLAEATREACLNAARHADADAVTVSVAVGGNQDRPRVTVVVSDDGCGFDPDAVAPERLGIRLSLVERMGRAGGSATVASEPGAGCRVTLGWAGRAPAPRPRGSGRRRDRHPLAQQVRVAPFGFTAGFLMTVFTALGWLSLGLYAAPGVAAAALLLAGLATPLLLWRFGDGLSPGLAAVSVSFVLVATFLAVEAMPPGGWPGHTTWFAGASSVLLVLVRIGGRRAVAWIGGSLYGIIVLLGASRSEMDFVVALGLALTPLLWLGIVDWFGAWVWSMGDELARAEAESSELAAANAAAFSKLVLREVWLADVRARVGGLIEKLADPDVPLTEADRARCLVTEGALRDSIRAGNLTSPALSLAILDARLRGVQVTLVDNRGSRLPDGVRSPVLKVLEKAVRGMASGRIVARTAPEGYDEAVTIVAVDSTGATTLTTVGHDGTIATRR